jgi:hypothetical protein
MFGLFSVSPLPSDSDFFFKTINPLKAELNPICHPLALLGAHHIFHVSGLRVQGAGGETRGEETAGETKA